MIRNTEELDGIRQSVERIEENLATSVEADSVEADQVPLPSQEDIVHPAPGRDLSVQHFLDGFRQLVGLELAEQHLTIAKTLSSYVVQIARLKFPDISNYNWSHMPMDQQNWMITTFEAGCRNNGAHVQRAKKKWIARGLLRQTWSAKGRSKAAKAPKTAARTGKEPEATLTPSPSSPGIGPSSPGIGPSSPGIGPSSPGIGPSRQRSTLEGDVFFSSASSLSSESPSPSPPAPSAKGSKYKGKGRADPPPANKKRKH
ncbi:hypothetical protein [Absidia glauca]|uniref:Uncharacterized protein n=1 Tax=Absidia glauca TaxID=4829 RepID=A0A168KWA4_ABSGL|nr:hypothetical protein [Absidia glauca]